MNQRFKKFTTTVLGLVSLGAGAAWPAGDLVLWYQQPVGNTIRGTAPPFINEALPIGNGRLGGLIAGGAARERIVLN